MVSGPLSSLTRSDAVNNVVVFVSDALRYDHVPECVRERGVTAKAVASSTYTASSLPSIFTGTYPARHRVWRFQDRLAERPRLFDGSSDHDVGFDAGTVWVGVVDKPPLRMHHIERERTLEELEPPFVHAIHDFGPHAPYGFDDGVWDTTEAFFEAYPDAEVLRELYEVDCRRSANRFRRRLDYLEDEDLLSDTLVVYTSDHGECLGERENGGRFGHTDPFCPAINYVPIAFMGAGLPRGESLDGLYSLVDVAPTALAATGRDVPDGLDGVDAWRETPPPDRTVRSDVWSHRYVDVPYLGERHLDAYAGSSVWDADGGVVFHRRSRLQRVAYMHLKSLLGTSSPAQRANWSLHKQLRQERVYASSVVEWGDPAFSRSEARRLLPDEFVEPDDPDPSADETLRDRLADLGYRQ